MSRLIILIFLVLNCAAALAASKVKFVSENGFIVTNQFTTERHADVVWAALVEDVDKWWPKDHTWWGVEGKLKIDPMAGGCFCEVAEKRSAEHMRISFVEPEKLLRMTGGLGPLQGMGMHGALDWQIQQQQDHIQVTLTYRVSGINPDGFEQLAKIVAQVQGLQLEALQNYVNRTHK
ncbi:SRPBCC domain-containing protein [Aliiglaciecola litoralis]|uniref:SRPBCC family protein n=1 Tax=Aliiglaciecola litoralis TaxID=582857 RepID=A0ABP3X4W8_9ALTE